MRDPPELQMHAVDSSEPKCSCFVCLDSSTAIITVSVIEIIFGSLVLPIFIILFWIGLIDSNLFMTNNVTTTLYFILLTKCIIMVIGGSIGLNVVKYKSVQLMMIYFGWIILRCIFQIVLMSMRQYEACIELFIWICLGLEFMRYYKYLKITASGSYQPL